MDGDRNKIYLKKSRIYAREHRFVGVDYIEVKPSSSVRENQTIHLNGIVGIDDLGTEEGTWDAKKGNYMLAPIMERTKDGKTIIGKKDVVVVTFVMGRETARMLKESLNNIL